jgi:nucleoside-diphosphate-sugar epimerase
MIEGKRVLITGGAGFIGSHVADRLARGNEITLLDINLENVLPYSPLAADDAVRKIQGDVRDADLIRQEVARADIVLHFASLIGVREVIENARATIDTIVVGTSNVLDAARRHGGIERLMYISTSEVYGNIVDAVEDAPASVGTGNDPRLCYASAKLLGEHLVWASRRDHELPTVIIRPFNIFGPRRKVNHAVGLFIVKALAGRDITVHGHGSQLRSWCYIEDFCDGIIACLEKDAAIGQDYNLGNPVTATTIYDLASRIIRLTGSASKIITTPHTYTDIGVRAPNSLKADEHLSYRPKYDMDAGLIPSIAWYREHLEDFGHWL